MKLLFDLDGFVYKAGFAGEKRERTVILKDTGEAIASLSKGERINDWCENAGYERNEVEVETAVKPDDIGAVLHTAKAMVESIKAEFQSEDMEAYISGTGNFRDAIYDQYKANRKGSPKPFHYEAIRKYYQQRYNAEVVDGKEADDQVSIRAAECAAGGIPYVIISGDKDFNTVPGLHYNPDTGTTTLVSPWEADLFFYSQLLAGDTADNIPGLPGIGMVTAKRMLEECETDDQMYSACAEEYYEYYGDQWEEIMHRNARLLYLLKKEDDEWQPPLDLDLTGFTKEQLGT